MLTCECCGRDTENGFDTVVCVHCGHAQPGTLADDFDYGDEGPQFIVVQEEGNKQRRRGQRIRRKRLAA